MTRVGYIFSVIGVLLFGCSSELPPPEIEAENTTQQSALGSEERPNFLLIVTDDMGYTDLGAFGGTDIPTPNLDSLAMGGLRLTNFHANVSCAPTRSMLLSGTGNHEAGMGSQWALPEFVGRTYYEGRLTDRVASLPERMLAEGYHTYMAGKWHLAGTDFAVLPSDRGFDRSFALIPGGWDHFALPAGSQKPDVGPAPDVPYVEDSVFLEGLPDDFYSTTTYVDKLIEYIDSNESSDQPFFAYFAPTAPHWPLQVLPAWRDRFAGDYDAGYEALCLARQQGADEAGVLPAGADLGICPEIAAPWDELTAEEQAINSRTMELYAAMVAHLDTELGRVLDYLESSGQLENTYIIYHNDNGPEGGEIFDRRSALSRFDNSLENLGRRNSWANLGQGWADAHSAPFRDQKSSPYEGGIRVPAFITSPETSEPGRISDSIVTVMDVMPTIMELAGITEASYPRASEVLSIRGASFASLLENPAAQIHASDEAIPLDHAGLSFMLQGDWKIVRPMGGTVWQLYNRADDPNELEDLSQERPDILIELVTKFESHASGLGMVPRQL